MSLELGMKAMRLQLGERLAHTEYCSNYALIRAVTGLDPRTDGAAFRAFNDAWDIDFIWNTNDGHVSWEAAGRTSDMGHAEFMEGGVDRRDTVSCPFKSADEVWAFDAVEEYGLPDSDELTAHYERVYQSGRQGNPNQVFTGGYYRTVVSGGIAAFGWDRFLEAAADRTRFGKVLESFFRLTRHHVEAWARTSAPIFIQHDDFVWSEGPFMHPSFYRAAIIPHYRALWDILHAAGKTVLFCSDANWSVFVDDIAQAGADGFIFEPMTALEPIVERYGRTHVIISSKVDCRTLTFGTKDQIRAEIDATLPLARQCPGFVFAIGNHLPSNVPVDNALFYMDYLRANWKR
jgi:hypothetical protein